MGGKGDSQEIVREIEIWQYESVLENEIHKVLWDFEIQTDHLITVRQSDQVINKKKKKRECANKFCCPDIIQSQIERKRKVR